MTKEDIDLVRLALSVYHTRTVYPGCVEAFERIVQEVEMPTPMTIEMEADERSMILKTLDELTNIASNYAPDAYYEYIQEAQRSIEAALLTKTPENVTCENLNNAYERQVALDALDRVLMSAERGTGNYSDYEVVKAALQSPRVPVIKILETVLEQAEDDGLWFNAKYASEAYLQQELRRLHAVIERAYAELQKGD